MFSSFNNNKKKSGTGPRDDQTRGGTNTNPTSSTAATTRNSGGAAKGGSLPRPPSLLTNQQFSQLMSFDRRGVGMSNDGGGEGDGTSIAGTNIENNKSFNVTMDPTVSSSISSSTFPVGTITAAAAAASALASHVPQRPRRVWAIQDTSIKYVPSYYPPLDPNCTCVVTDVPPSLIVVRISECLRKRSIAAEYDDENVRATCLTVDRTSFYIQLYKGGSTLSMMSPSSGPAFATTDTTTATDTATTTTTSDNNVTHQAPGAVIVECQRIAGTVTSFHKACQAVLKAAKGIESGAIIEDEKDGKVGSDKVRTVRRLGGRLDNLTQGLEFQSLKRRRLQVAENLEQKYSSIHPVLIARDTIETVQDFLRKDRLECQQLGMERLVNMTSFEIAGAEVSTETSRQIIEQPEFLLRMIVHPEARNATLVNQAGVATSNRKSRAFRRRNRKDSRGDIIQGNQDEGDDEEDANAALIRSFLESAVSMTPQSKNIGGASNSSGGGEGLIPKKSEKDGGSTDSIQNLSPDEYKHEARLHSMALRVLCNCLHNLSVIDQLQSILYRDSLYTALNNKPGSDDTGTLGFQSTDNSLIQPPVLLSLVRDLMGASRPQSVAETGYRLASVHEAALAVRCLRLLAGDGDDDELDSSPFSKVRAFLLSEPVLERLDLARACGRSTHLVLQEEAEKTYKALTEDVRSC